MAAEPSPRGGYVLLCNPSAGGGRALERLPAIQAAMRAHGLSSRVVATTDVKHGCDEAVAAAAGGEVPVVISGDGLIGQIGGALTRAGAEVPMGILPGGRGNDLARVLGIPTDPAESVAVLATGHRRRIDVGDVNGERFLCIASCGFDSDANRIANQARLVKGSFVYAYAALRALAQWKPARFTVTLDGERRDFTGYSVAVANSRAYGGGMFVAPDAVLDDGLLDVITTGRTTKRRFLLNLPKVFKGTHVDSEPVEVHRAAEVRIEADRPFEVYADGDHLTDLPATVTVIPRALEVIAPERREEGG